MGKDRCLNGDFVEIERSRGKVKNADETVFRMVFLAVEVGFVSASGTSCGFIVVVLQKMVHFLQSNDLKDEQRQQVGGDAAICSTVFQ